MSTTDDQRPRKTRRVRTGCLTCRARKVKCDEAKDVCRNCRTLDAACVWPGSTDDEVPVGHGSSAQIYRNPRRLMACTSCREARSQCSKDKPSCSRCVVYNLECVYPSRQRLRSLPQPSTSGSEYHVPLDNRPPALSLVPTGHEADVPNFVTTPATAHSQPSEPSLNRIPLGAPPPAGILASVTTSFGETCPLPSRDRSERLFAAYFNYHHHYHANSFLNRDMVLQDLRADSLSLLLRLCVWAVAARFVLPAEEVGLAAQWATRAGELVMESTEFSRENIIACLLLAAYAQHEGQYPRGHVYCAIANRQALSLGLHRENVAESIPWVEQERDRRLYLACYCLERVLSDGTPESIYCPAVRISVRLPCSGFHYRLGLMIETPPADLEQDGEQACLATHQNVGVSGFYARLAGVRFCIKQCHLAFRQSTGGFVDGNEPWNPTSPYARCIAKLCAIRDTLPPPLRLSMKLFRDRRQWPGLPALVMLYLRWHLSHLELYRFALSGYPESLPDHMFLAAPEGWLTSTRNACLRHAQHITFIATFVSEGPDPLLIVDHTLPRLAYSCIRVQVEQAAELHSDPAAIERLTDSFQVLSDMVGRTAPYFRPAQLLHKEIKRMIARHNLSRHPASVDQSRAVTPPHPWFRQQKKIDDDTLADSLAAMLNGDFDFFEGLFSNINPSYGLARNGWATLPPNIEDAPLTLALPNSAYSESSLQGPGVGQWVQPDHSLTSFAEQDLFMLDSTDWMGMMA